MSDTAYLEKLESDDDKIEGSPSNSQKSNNQNNRSSPPSNNSGLKYDIEQEGKASLNQELTVVRNMNEVIEKVLSSLECAQDNMATVSQTVNSASVLLDTWVRVLSHTEHNQKLIMNLNWKGASADIANMENESILKAQAEEKRELEEERRKEEIRKREEEKERHLQVSNTGRRYRGVLGRPRGLKRGNLNSSDRITRVASSTQNSERGISTSRTASGIGRSTVISRGKFRGIR